jgi:hypothetical protein
MPQNKQVANHFAAILNKFAADAKPLLVEFPTPHMEYRVYESRYEAEPIAEFFTREAAENYLRLADINGAYISGPLTGNERQPGADRTSRVHMLGVGLPSWARDINREHGR